MFTQRSELPVSRCNRKLWAGVPNVALAKYNVSYHMLALTDFLYQYHKLTSLSNDASTVSDLLRNLSLNIGFGVSLLDTGNPTTRGGPSVRLCN